MCKEPQVVIASDVLRGGSGEARGRFGGAGNRRIQRVSLLDGRCFTKCVFSSNCRSFEVETKKDIGDVVSKARSRRDDDGSGSVQKEAGGATTQPNYPARQLVRSAKMYAAL